MNRAIRRALGGAAALMLGATLATGHLGPATPPPAQADDWSCYARLTGTVRSAAGKPLKGILVTGDKVGDNDPSRAYTNRSGRYVLHLYVCQGAKLRVTAGASAAWQLPSTWTGRLTSKTPVLNRTLKSAAQLRISVKNGTKFRFPRVKVVNTKTRKDVTTSIRRLNQTTFRVPAGKYRVYVSGNRTNRIVVAGAKSRTVKASAGKRATARFAIDRGGAISGRVAPRPVNNYCFGYGWVTVRSDRGFKAGVRVSKSGAYTIKNLPAGKYRVHLYTGSKKYTMRSDYYRAGTSKVKSVSVKNGKTTKLKTAKLRNKEIGRPSLGNIDLIYPRCMGEG